MKLSKDYKTRLHFSAQIFLVFSLVFTGIFLHAQTADELKNKIDAKTSEIEKLEKDIKAFQAQLNALGQQKASLAGSIKELDLTKKKLNADIAVTQSKIDRKNLEISELSSDISVKEVHIDNNRDVIAGQLRSIAEYERNGLTETILSSDSNFTSMWNDIDSMLALREEIQKQIVELQQIKGELEDTREISIEAKNELTLLRAKLSDQKKIVEQNTAEKNKLLTQTKNSESNYQKLVAEKSALKASFEKEVSDYESQLKYILDPKSLPTNRPLSWPLDSIIYVTSPFGPRWGSFHSGTDFRAAVGTPVRAMANGVVGGVGDTDASCRGASFGKWVFIKYDNGLSSTYGHLSLIKAYSGQKVTPGTVVAYSGNTGSSTGPHLHVTVYAPNAAEVKTFPSKSCLGKSLTQPMAATNAYLNPMDYLPKL